MWNVFNKRVIIYWMELCGASRQNDKWNSDYFLLIPKATIKTAVCLSLLFHLRSWISKRFDSPFWVVFHYHARHHYADHYLIKAFTSLPVFSLSFFLFSFSSTCTHQQRRKERWRRTSIASSVVNYFLYYEWFQIIYFV